MITSSRQRLVFPAFFVLVVLAFGSLPAGAQPARQPLEKVRKVAVPGSEALSWVRGVFASLWQRERTKEGPSIDPDGQPGQQGDEGITIDPDSSK